jgi:glyoxylase-like metal-dependent hydrolase (beta-lactamase superfamily II)
MKNYTAIGLFLSVIAVTGANESSGIFSYKVGQYEVYMIVESERNGNTGILVEPDEAVLKRYIPADGFKHSANAFLIKTPEQYILIDTGTGSGGIVIDKIKSLGVQPENITAVLITHLHGDHFGTLQREGTAVFPNAKIYLSAREHEFFTKTNIDQGAVAALAPYGSNVVTFESGTLGSTANEILPGIIPIAAYGHTPGHTIFLIQNGGENLLLIGDLLHIALVQFPVPEISAIYDTDANTAAVIRRQVLDYAAKNKIPLGGMHIVYPGVGTVEADGEGFKFVPVR